MKMLWVMFLVAAVGTMSRSAFIVDVDDERIAIDTDRPILGYCLSLKVQDGPAGGDLAFGAVTLDPELMWDFPMPVQTQTDKQVWAGGSQGFCPPQGPGTLFTVGYTGTGWLDLMKSGWAGSEGSLLESVFVPEPMTLGLLGVGVLFLRRRR